MFWCVLLSSGRKHLFTTAACWWHASDQSEASIQVIWSLWTNQRPVSRLPLMTCQWPCRVPCTQMILYSVDDEKHVLYGPGARHSQGIYIFISGQWEASIQVTWSARIIFTYIIDISWLIDWFLSAWNNNISIKKSVSHITEASMHVTRSPSTNQRPVSRSCAQSQLIRGYFPDHVITLNQSETIICPKI